MTERAYTVAEIDALRAVMHERYLWGSSWRDPHASGSRMSGSFKQEDLDKGIEQLIRTAMMAGHTAEDILAEDKRRGEARYQ